MQSSPLNNSNNRLTLPSGAMQSANQQPDEAQHWTSTPSGPVGDQASQQIALLMQQNELLRQQMMQQQQLIQQLMQQQGAEIQQQRSLRAQLTIPRGSYDGDVFEGKPHGRGVLTYTDNGIYRVYEGEFKHGLIHGRGVMKYKNNDRYEGEWEDNMMQGQGTWTSSTQQTKYVGSWVKGKRCGYGEMTAEKGGIFKGTFIDDNNYNGTMSYPNGTIDEGEWKNGVFWRGNHSWVEQGERKSLNWSNGSQDCTIL